MTVVFTCKPFNRKKTVGPPVWHRLHPPHSLHHPYLLPRHGRKEPHTERTACACSMHLAFLAAHLTDARHRRQLGTRGLTWIGHQAQWPRNVDAKM